MARKPRAQKFETRSARAALAPNPKPYRVATLARGVTLTYRRNKKPPHPWGVKVANGAGDHWIRRLADADDHADANGKSVLDYAQAIPAALALARGGSAADNGAPVSWSQALDDYAADLKARGGSLVNASRVRRRLPPSLLDRPVSLLTTSELKRWRNALVASAKKPATVNRLLVAAKASLNLAADHDPERITNRNAWKVGLAGVADAYQPINRVLSDAEVRRLAEEAYGLDQHFGLFIEVLAVCGPRSSQACALLVRDLQADRLLVPASKKGGGRTRKVTHTPVPIPPSLAAKLKIAAGARDPSEPLLTRADGTAWNSEKQELRNLFAEVARRTGIGGTAYQLRHSSIVRSLLAGTPTQLVASLHNTSPSMLTRTYARFIAHHGDEVARRGLLDITAPPSGSNVTPLRGRS